MIAALVRASCAFDRPGLARRGAQHLRLRPPPHARRRAAPPRLVRRRGASPGRARRLCQHGPGGDRAVRGDGRTSVPRAGPGLGRRRRRASLGSGGRRLLPFGRRHHRRDRPLQADQRSRRAGRQRHHAGGSGPAVLPDRGAGVSRARRGAGAAVLRRQSAVPAEHSGIAHRRRAAEPGRPGRHCRRSRRRGDPGVAPGGRQAPQPLAVVALLGPGQSLPPAHPAAGKTMLDGRPTAYVCVGASCSLPIVSVEDLQRHLASG